MAEHNELQITCIPVGMIDTNCYLLENRAFEHEAVLVDPGGSSDRLIAYLKEKKLELTAILITHGHDDHTMAVQDLKDAYPDAQIMISENERRMVGDRSMNCGFFGDVRRYAPDRWLTDGEELMLLGLKIKVLSTPGHTEGSACFYLPEAELLLAGDTLFRGSYGRTDLPTGSMSQLIESLRMLLTTLPEETQVLSGHGPSTTIGYEKKIQGFGN